MECKVKWIGSEGMSFVAETESGHAFVMDGARDGGGRNLGPRPMETVLAGTGGCTAYDVVLILRKSGQSISACESRPKPQRAGNQPKEFPKIHMAFPGPGKKFKTPIGGSAIQLFHRKKFSAS